MNTTLVRVLFLVFSILISGCSVIPVNAGRLEGKVWCDARYLPDVKEYKYPSDDGWKHLSKKLDLSKKGYMYAVAAVLALQKNNTETRFHFSRPSRLEEIENLNVDLKDGFQATTFLLRPPNPSDRPVIVIAFAGSNQWIDYTDHNFAFNPVQYADARKYIKEVAAHPLAAGLDKIVTGFSLGGGLSVHVTKNDETSALVKEAWIFNPTPRAGVEDGIDPRIHLLSTSYEILKKFNRDGLGAPESQTIETYGLIRSSSIYSHYRWVLTRQVLWYADMALYLDSGKKAVTTEPLEILRTQKVNVCTPTD